MKRFLWIMMTLLILSCSAPKYTYYFDKVDYYAGKKYKSDETDNRCGDNKPITLLDEVKESGPAVIDPASLMASTDTRKIMTNDPVTAYKQMTRAEKKEFRREIKKQIKSQIKATREGDNDMMATARTSSMDPDLKMAAIFGSVGLVFLLIGGNVFWVLGAIAMIVGVVFFVMWLSRQ